MIHLAWKVHRTQINLTHVYNIELIKVPLWKALFGVSACFSKNLKSVITSVIFDHMQKQFTQPKHTYTGHLWECQHIHTTQKRPLTNTQTHTHTCLFGHTFLSKHLKTPPSSSSPHSAPSFPFFPTPSLCLEMTVLAVECLPSPPLGVFLFPAPLKCWFNPRKDASCSQV